MGIDADAQRAVLDLRKTWIKGGEKPLFVTVAGMGCSAEFQSLLGDHLIGPARVWINQTPYVPPRHIKKRGANTVVGQAQRELVIRYHRDAKFELLTRDEMTKRRFHQFVRLRRDQTKQPPQDCFYGLRLTFEREASGPITLGYASHFGLGLFFPAP